VPDPKWGEAVAAVIKPKMGYQISPEDIKAYLRDKIASYKIPKYIWIDEEVPKTAVGKVDYSYLKKKYSGMIGNA
jgi:acyl-CoA synthetase (AMP-forming)/AMP-acid ligase II